VRIWIRPHLLIYILWFLISISW